MNGRRRITLIAAAIIMFVAVWNWPVKYRVGVDGVLFEKRIPLYAKACGYLYRDWMYKDIVNGIVKGKEGDDAKVLAILHWTRENVKNSVPRGLKVMDDHPLNIVIRQYGCDDQLNDIFTILCSYAGFRAGMKKCYSADGTRCIIFSLVRIDGEWLIFEAAKGKYFLNKKGSMASIKDYTEGDLVLTSKDAALYKEFLDDLKKADLSTMTRADEQMPLRRIPAQLKKAIKNR